MLLSIKDVFYCLNFYGQSRKFLAIFQVSFYFNAVYKSKKFRFAGKGEKMAHFLYISDVFCPWCFGFSGNIAKIKKEFGLPFEVYAGALVEPPVNLAEYVKKRPNIQEFAQKMFAITGVKISDRHIAMLSSDHAEEIVMDSRKGSHLFYVLKQIKPDMALEIMEFLQNRFYMQGDDIFSKETLRAFAEQFQADPDEISVLLNDKKYEDLAYSETEKGFDILGEIVLYPTLYYVDDSGERHFVSRGYVELEACRKAVLNIIDAIKNKQALSAGTLMGKFCTLDGKCE